MDRQSFYQVSKYLVIIHTFISIQDANRSGMRETIVQVGFVYYFILARFYDIDPKLNKEGSGNYNYTSVVNNSAIFVCNMTMYM